MKITGGLKTSVQLCFKFFQVPDIESLNSVITTRGRPYYYTRRQGAIAKYEATQNLSMAGVWGLSDLVPEGLFFRSACI